MASDSSVLKKLKQIPRKTTTATDMEDVNDLAIHYGEELAYAIASKEDCVIGGFAVSFDSGADVSISAGSALKQGQLIKNTAAVTKTIAENASGSDRIDLVSISGVTETDSDNLIEPVLGAISLNDFGKPTPTSIGTGDDSTTLFELPLASDERALNDTLLIYLDGVLSGGWSFAPAQGSSGEDSIVFHDAPGAGVAITAAGDFVTGGEEALPTSPGLPSRSALTAEITVTQGVPGGGAPALPSNNVWLCEITVPAGWSTGNTLTFDNEVEKVFLAAKDQGSDSSDHSPFDRPARLSDSIRNMAQVRHGCRLRYSSSTQIKVGPGFLVSHGLACRNTEDVSLTLQSTSSGTAGYVPSTDWYAIYAVPQAPNANGSGVPFSLDVGSLPNSLGQDTQSPVANAGTFYLGSVYCTVSGATVTLREFYSDGDGWVWWASPSTVAMAHNTDVDFSDWVPYSARMVEIEAAVSFNPSSGGDTCIVAIRSHKVATAKSHPRVFVEFVAHSSTAESKSSRGTVKLEEDSGSLHCHASITPSAGNATATGRILGYKDDYSITDTAGAILFY